MKDEGLRQNADFLRKTLRQSILACMISILSGNIAAFIGGVLVGNKIGPNALAAINLSLPLYLFLCVMGSLITSGTAVCAAREIGRDNSEKAQQYYSTCVSILTVASVIITAVGLACRGPLVSFLCSDASIRPYVAEYVTALLIGAFAKIMIYIPFWYLRLDGANAQVMIMMTVMSVCNIALAILFINVLEMGMFGAGLASVASSAVALIMGFVYLGGKKSFFRFKPYILRGKENWSEMLGAGMPSALNNLFSTIRLLFINSTLMGMGGADMVAVFSAVNGIAGFAECITGGVPQAASPMLGVFCGEKDNGSSKMLVKIQCTLGAIYTAVFLVICVAGSGLIGRMYGLEQPLMIPLLWLALSTFPALFMCIISGYYNTAEMNNGANLILFVRLIFATCLGLWLVRWLNLSTFSFLLIAELLSVAIWLFATMIYHKKYPKKSRYLFMDNELEEKGMVLNFSVEATDENICSASEQISDFCSANGMSPKKIMTLQLAMEEILTLIKRVNDSQRNDLRFDLRAYSVLGVNGIRIRYGGKDFNPFAKTKTIGFDDDDMYMGISMIEKMVEFTKYQRTFGVNTLQIVLHEERKTDSNEGNT